MGASVLYSFYTLVLLGAQSLLSFTGIVTLRALDEMCCVPRSTGIGVDFPVLRGIYCAGSGEMLVTFCTWERTKYIQFVLATGGLFLITGLVRLGPV